MAGKSTDKFIVFVVVTQDMADVLTQITFDALTKFLDTLDIFLMHRPTAILIVRLTRFERFDFFFDSIVERNVRHQVLHQRERSHRLDSNWFTQVVVAQPGHAHQFWVSVYFG